MFKKDEAQKLEEALAYFQAGKSLRECEKLTGIEYSKIRREAKKRGLNCSLPQSTRRGIVPLPNILYLVTATEFGDIYKIGITNDIDFRIKSMQTGCPYKLFSYRAYQMENPLASEQALHAFFRNKRLEGEWFRLSNQDLSYIDEAFLNG